MGVSLDYQQRFRRLLVQQLESLARAGVEQVARKRPPSPLEPPPSPSEPLSSPAKEEPVVPHASTAKRQVDRPSQLAAVQSEVAGCRRCPELAASRTQTVFGVGNAHTRLCFMGEAPGADEDRQGIPFVGRAGRLLTDMIEKGMGLVRGDVYILNVLKCRPPENRTPNSQEVNNCREYLERQLEILKPEFICCLGTVAAQALLKTTTPVGKLRGKFHQYQDSRVIVTYHPSYLLRSPEMKKEAWKDLQMLMAEMGLAIPKKS